MLFFYVDSAERASSGVSQIEFDQNRLYRSLEHARKDARGKIFVVDGRKIPARLSGEVKRIPEKAFLNLDPYLKPKEVNAGGGIVTREGKKGLEILLIYRKNLWDLPKGKLDPGETIRKCAKREVREELGTKLVKILDFLDTTTHGYAEKGSYIVKTTHWYFMSTSATEFVPQKEERITRVKWVTLKKAKKILGHESLARLLARVEHQLLFIQKST